ncbi:hypothetical protein HMPREF7215_1208 [Pyramidobacter piscolens W5455]|uniref:Uncharacterized protein n=1 Tax=Pyramidobacter piscolens W5455 TaxID=352165 RepID=A0ABM9ZTX3_9BACT|nr:hypothetical protein HMPREF7215_1208 [Pyramidobacter piscolens W5455]
MIKGVNIVCRALRGGPVAQDYLDRCAVCVTLPRRVLVFGLVIEK